MTIYVSACACLMCAIPVVHKIGGFFRHWKVAERYHLFADVCRGRG